MFKRITDKTLDLLCLTPLIHIESDREMLIENCRRIEEYNDIFIKILAGDLIIQIWGNGLRADDRQTDALIIRGKISHIEFEERRKNRRERPDKRLR